ncbi:V-set and transmembrane domain-containing protein 2A [Neolamprologus brichardi]|uniref:V-set and transmembrane domain-containing protein 2A n=1 Tax=Neolamprologus brichardi TaxID=32507 RepID=UPI001643A7C3|nr:V-set and transmembrane domain-containing protein 2A [Neolamprologus brichardi]
MMWTSHDTVGFVFLTGFCVQFGFSFEGRFTDLPSNMTVKEGQNIEMACAFQSGTASVYLEIQWWFVKAPEPSDSEEDIDAQEMEMIQEPDPDDEGTKISSEKEEIFLKSGGRKFQSRGAEQLNALLPIDGGKGRRVKGKKKI